MGKRILVVDDEPDVVTVMKFTLETRGFEVVTAYDGEEGLRKVKTENPDLIILDVLMPKMYGNTLVAELENNPETKNIPIIFLSCLVNDEDRGRNRICGATFCFLNHVVKKSCLRLWIEP